MAQQTKQLPAAEGSAGSSPTDIQAAVFESLALKGDISNLSPMQKVLYMEKLCKSLGLNPLTQPFKPLKLSGKEVLYADRGCTDQLSFIHKLTREILNRETIDNVLVVTAKVTGPDGRVEISTGAVPISGLKGDSLANAYMKCETKAKRRGTLSYCGLGFLDESEIETIPQDRVEFLHPPTKAELVEAVKVVPPAEPQQPAGEAAEEPQFTGPPADSSLDNAMTETELAWRKEIDALLRKAGSGPRVMLAKFDSQPQDREKIYIAVLREVVKRVLASDDWSLNEQGTTAYLEKFGVTAIDGGSRGQLEAVITDLRELGNL